MELIDKEYTRSPFYGTRRITEQLRREGHNVNRKRIQRLMRLMGLQGVAPKPGTSKPHPDHEVYPYLLEGFRPTRPNQVWSTDITYCALDKGFMYLVAVIDWHSRYILSWELSNTLDAEFCVVALERALERGKPEIFNTDQGCQFTSKSVSYDHFWCMGKERKVAYPVD